MFFNAPAVDVTHFGKDKRGRSKCAVAVAERGLNSRVAEADDIGAAVAIEVAHDPEVFGHLPTLICVESRKHQFWWLKRAVSIAQGDPNAIIPKPDQVRFAITRHINHKARVLID